MALTRRENEAISRAIKAERREVKALNKLGRVRHLYECRRCEACGQAIMNGDPNGLCPTCEQTVRQLERGRV